MTYPIDAQLTYGYDSMGRPNSLVDTLVSPSNFITNATYNVANRLTQITYGNSTTETRTYNTLRQLTSIQKPGLTMQYVYSPTNNNGQITQAVDSLSGEQISYGYDSLKRLISASSTTIGSNPAPIWGQTFQYDGFGNLTDMNPTTGPAPALHQTVDPHSNQVGGSTYDLNGNSTASGLGYDVENRLATTGGGTFYASYGPDNKRIFRAVPGQLPELSIYGIDGRLLAKYSQNANGTFTSSSQYSYFAGQLVAQGSLFNTAIATDRLGSVRYSGGASMKFYPYGQDFATNPGNDQKKFGTYTRDSVTGLDYADQRYYNSEMGRFMTPDLSSRGVRLGNPISWGMYLYVGDDPVNLYDPTGERSCADWRDCGRRAIRAGGGFYKLLVGC